MKEKELVEDYESLLEASYKCQRGVRWKPSTKAYAIDGVAETYKLRKKLLDGTWKNSEPREILITYPKRRTGLSIPFRDRVYQRSINDNVLYPQTTKHFIDGNAACQKDRGTSYARKLAKKYLWRMYRNHGKNFYVLQIDVKGYYPNMRHDVAYNCIRKYVSSDTADAVENILSKQYKGDVGFNPGSQMVQIVGISLLNGIDHYIKEQLHIKNYIRYMDDFFILHENAEYLKHCKDTISKQLEAIGLKAHPDKTHITHIKDGFELLGFKYRMTDTGKVIMSVNSQNVKHEKRKLRRMVNKCKLGEMGKRKVNECFGDWKKTHAEQGNSYSLITRMDKYYKELWRNDNEDSKELRA